MDEIPARMRPIDIVNAARADSSGPESNGQHTFASKMVDDLKNELPNISSWASNLGDFLLNQAQMSSTPPSFPGMLNPNTGTQMLLVHSTPLAEHGMTYSTQRTFLPAPNKAAAVASFGGNASEDSVMKRLQREIEFERRRAEFQVQEKEKEIIKLRRLLDAQREALAQQKDQLTAQERNLMEYQRLDQARAHGHETLGRRMEQRVNLLQKHLVQSNEEREQLLAQANRRLQARTQERDSLAAALVAIATQLKQGMMATGLNKTSKRGDLSDTLPCSPDVWIKVQSDTAATLNESAVTERLSTKRRAFQGDGAQRASEIVVTQVQRLQDALLGAQQLLADKEQQIAALERERVWVQEQYLAVENLLQEVMQEALTLESHHDAGTIHTALALAPQTLAGRLQSLVTGLKMVFRELAVRDKELKKHQARLAELEFYRTLQARAVNDACQRLNDSGALSNMTRHITSPPTGADGRRKSSNLAPVFERLFAARVQPQRAIPVYNALTPLTPPMSAPQHSPSAAKVAGPPASAPELRPQGVSTLMTPTAASTAKGQVHDKVGKEKEQEGKEGKEGKEGREWKEGREGKEGKEKLQAPVGRMKSVAVAPTGGGAAAGAKPAVVSGRSQRSITGNRGRDAERGAAGKVAEKSPSVGKNRNTASAGKPPRSKSSGRLAAANPSPAPDVTQAPSAAVVAAEDSSVSLVISLDEEDNVKVTIEDLAASVVEAAASLGLKLDDVNDLRESSLLGQAAVDVLTKLHELSSLDGFLGVSMSPKQVPEEEEEEEEGGVVDGDRAEGDDKFIGLEEAAGLEGVELLKVQLQVVDEKVQLQPVDTPPHAIRLPGFDDAILHIRYDVVDQESVGGGGAESAMGVAGSATPGAVHVGRLKLWCEVVGADDTVKLTITNVHTGSRVSTPLSRAAVTHPSDSNGLHSGAVAEIDGESSIVGSSLGAGERPTDVALVTLQCESAIRAGKAVEGEGPGRAVAAQGEDISLLNSASTVQLITMMCEVVGEKVVVSLMDVRPTEGDASGATLPQLTAPPAEEDSTDTRKALETTLDLMEGELMNGTTFSLPSESAGGGLPVGQEQAVVGDTSTAAADTALQTLQQWQGSPAGSRRANVTVTLVQVRVEIGEEGALKLLLDADSALTDGMDCRAEANDFDDVAPADGSFMGDGVDSGTLVGVEAGSGVMLESSFGDVLNAADVVEEAEQVETVGTDEVPADTQGDITPDAQADVQAEITPVALTKIDPQTTPESLTEVEAETAAEDVEAGADATEAVTDATETAAEAVEAGADTTEVVTDATETGADATETVTDATEALTDATETAADAVEAEADATEAGADTTETGADATETVTDATEALTDATEIAADAVEAEADATEAGADTTEAGADTTETGADATETAADATEAVTDATEAVTDAAETAAEAVEAGTDATEAGADATETAADATEAVTDAAETAAEMVEAGADATEAGADATETAADATEAGVDATETGADATEAGLDATETAAEAVEAGADATEAVAEAIESEGGATEVATDAAEAAAEAPENSKTGAISVAVNDDCAAAVEPTPCGEEGGDGTAAERVTAAVTGLAEDAERGEGGETSAGQEVSHLQDVGAVGEADGQAVEAVEQLAEFTEQVAAAVEGLAEAVEGLAEAIEQVAEAAEQVADDEQAEQAAE